MVGVSVLSRRCYLILQIVTCTGCAPSPFMRECTRRFQRSVSAKELASIGFTLKPGCTFNAGCLPFDSVSGVP